LIIVGCSRIKGKIEKRDKACDEILNSKRVFIVNKSKTEKYKFTIKSIETIDDTIKKYSTDQIILEAGDEEDLGCDFYFSDQKYLPIEKNIILGVGNDKISNSKILVGFADGSIVEIDKRDKQKAIESGATVLLSNDRILKYKTPNGSIVDESVLKKKYGDRFDDLVNDGSLVQINLSLSDKIYFYNGILYSEVEIMEAPRASNLDIDTYLSKVGASRLYDTLINNIKLKYYKQKATDSTKLLSQKKHSLKYEVTGQVLVKEKAE
jgi:hypothetical protein